MSLTQMSHGDQRFFVFVVINDDGRRIRHHCSVVDLFVEFAVAPSDKSDPLSVSVGNVYGQTAAVVEPIVRAHMYHDPTLRFSVTSDPKTSHIRARQLCPRYGIDVGKVYDGTEHLDVDWRSMRRATHQQQTVGHCE